MVNCPYLVYKKSHCAACTGWTCQAFGRNKRLSDTSMCIVNEEWLECVRYTQKIGTVKAPKPGKEVVDLPLSEEITSFVVVDTKASKVTIEPEPVEVQAPLPAIPTDCPYLSPDPASLTCCSGFWCDAINEPLRSYKICKSPPSWGECHRFFKAARQGVK